MKTFTISKQTHRITPHATAQDAKAVADAAQFSTEAELAKLTADWSPVQLIHLWNNLPGVIPVKKFKDRATAVSRIWKAVQSSNQQPERVVPKTPRPDVSTLAAPQTPNVADEEVPAKRKAKRPAKASKPSTNQTPRQSSKTKAILALLKKPGGSTLKAIMEATNWQAHSVRGFISGTLGKKMGLTVLSAKNDNGDRSYSIPS